jgi:hypothetical protein
MLPVLTPLIALVFLHPTNRRTSRVNHQKPPLPRRQAVESRPFGYLARKAYYFVG